MGRTRVVVLAVAVVAAVVVAGAWTRGGDRERSAPIVRSAPPTTASTAAVVPADPYAVPATIDAAYLNRVLAVLEQVDGDAARIIVGERLLVPDAAERLRAIYGIEEVNDQLRLWGDGVEEGFEGLRDPLGNRATTVQRIITASPSCVFVEVLRDYSATVSKPSAPLKSYLALKPLNPRMDPKHYNPTPWAIAYAGLNKDGSVPDSPCRDS